MMDNFLTATIYILATDLMVNLIVGVVFPMLVIGLAVKFMRNLDKN